MHITLQSVCVQADKYHLYICTLLTTSDFALHEQVCEMSAAFYNNIVCVCACVCCETVELTIGGD